MIKVVQSLEDPLRTQKVLDAFTSVIGSGFYAEGHFCHKADAELTRYLKTPTCTMNSCGSALYVMYRFYYATGYRYVVVQNNTFYATGAMANEAGLVPILCDSRPDDPSMSVDSLLRILKSHPEARLVVITHVGGWLAKDYERIVDVCEQKKITLVEDCAHAFGLSKAGTLGAAACWSFYPTKAIPIGEGGALSTKNSHLFEYAEKFRKYGKYIDHKGILRYHEGMNLRMSEWDAAVLCVQLEFIPRILAARRADAVKLQSIAPCLLEGESNYYKYPVPRWRAEGLETTGSVYARSDQLDQCIKALKVVPLSNSHQWAINHRCLPIGENIYEGLTPESVQSLLAKESHADTSA